MPKVTIVLDEAMLRAGREYASAHGTTLSAMIGDLLRQTVQPTDPAPEFLALADAAAGSSGGAVWSRDELHERR